MSTLPAHYFVLEDTLIDSAGDLPASYHLVEDGEAFDVVQPPQSLAAPLSGSKVAVTFNGQNSFACLASTNATSALCFWICPEGIDGAQVFLSRGVTLEDRNINMTVGHRDGRLRITFGPEVWRAADRHFHTGVWTHIALLFTGETPQIFIDGEALMSSQVVRPRSSAVDTELLATGEGALLLGAEPAGDASPVTATEAAAFGLHRFFDGSLDGLGLWNRDVAVEGLTAVAIRRLASGGPPDLCDQSAAAAPPQTEQKISQPAIVKSARQMAPLQKVAEIAKEQPEPAAPEAEIAASPTDDANDEIWNELKDLVTSINEEEPVEANEPHSADGSAAYAMPDLSTGLDPDHCSADAKPAPLSLVNPIAAVDDPGTDQPETVTAESNEESAPDAPLVVIADGETGSTQGPIITTDEASDDTQEDVKDTAVDAVSDVTAETAVGNLCDEATDPSSLDQNDMISADGNYDADQADSVAIDSSKDSAPEAPPELDVDAGGPLLLLAAPELEKSGTHVDSAPSLPLESETEFDKAEMQGPPDPLSGSNAALASTLIEECAEADNTSNDAPDMAVNFERELAARTEANPAAGSKAISDMVAKVAPPAKRLPRTDDEADQRQRLRDALSDTSTAEARSRFRLFSRSRKKRNTSLPDLRGVRPRFNHQAQLPAHNNSEPPAQTFCYEVSGAFADRVVDFGSPIRVKLVPDYAAKPLPRKSAGQKPALRTRSPRGTGTPTAATFDELLDTQADELLFR